MNKMVKKILLKKYKEILKKEYKQNIIHYRKRLNNLKKTKIDDEINNEVEWLKNRKKQMNRMKLDKSKFENTIYRKTITPKITTSKLIRCPYCHSKILDESIEICEMCGEVLNNF